LLQGRDYRSFCDRLIVPLFDSNGRIENRSDHGKEKTECLVGVHRAGGFRCMRETANGRTKEYSARFFSVSQRFAGKPLQPEIASTQVSTSSDCAHDLANRDAYSNADTGRAIN
jgi:hypothetical protein